MKKIIILLVFLLTSCTKITYLDLYHETSKDDYEIEYSINDSIFKSISYNEFISMIDNKETFVFYFGGSWCINCRTVAPLINEVGIINDIIIYNFDPRNNNKEEIDDFRKCNTFEQEELYKEFINKLSYNSNNTVYVEDEYGNKRDTNIPYLAVPALFAIKDGVIHYELIEEYDELNEENTIYYKEELQILINKTHH